MLSLLSVLAGIVLLIYVYVRFNDQGLSQLPSEALAFSPNRFTPHVVRETAEKLSSSPRIVKDILPAKTGRRYIVVGTGFLGGWIIIQLLQRGEDPKKIRILDIRTPTRSDLRTGLAAQVAFFKVDISNAKAVDDAFQAPWPDSDLSDTEPEVTVFHTAANMRFYERHLALLPRSSKVNHEGTQNVIHAARSIGVTVLVYTSSGSISVRRSRFWLWPWEKRPKHFVQVINDDDNLIPKYHDHFFSNYAASKILGQRAVRAADGSRSGEKILRTGCIRPGNGVFGPGGDLICGAYLIRKYNYTWVANIMQSFVYVENCALAHLCYEARLLETARGGSNPDLGGQAFTITDTGPPVTYSDIYVGLTTLAPETTFTEMSPTCMLFISQIIEVLYLSRTFLTMSSLPMRRALAHFIPNIVGDTINLQPSLFALVSVHLIFDDSRARLPPEKGGLGYHGPFTTLEGLCRTAEEHFKAGENGEGISNSGGISLDFFGLFKARKEMTQMNKMEKRISDRLHVEAVDVLG
ncbi:3-beta hydroxysteroid dehydrogenase/isomerase family-domain-containing protein [Suillus fuscotomentosus]|uniref:3-beta hydroxysteroid dehydrogenase/isomerase family-domain-containing protein n=1 Tax=Suillus fuscotomentosus TaxID=1912939 RepID=A0AAD4EA19_9AGAM|nr:3-beta hydroxysteroid dehydrogenase/isomerase family-domain-containing protein [Suillus fuscotomentosus]KAG1902361.1 3-beta hydroxysteroid dehydrogenase/isomerase family-domain-containing protein [Suillus fuscotomentosus]